MIITLPAAANRRRPRRRRRTKNHNAAMTAGAAYSYAMGWRPSNLILPAAYPDAHCGINFYYQAGLWMPLHAKVTSLSNQFQNSPSISYTPMGIWAGAADFEEPPIPETASSLWENPDTVTEEILAYRAWGYRTRLLPDCSVEVLLISLNQNTVWDGPTITAHEPPDKDNTSGLYAVGLQKHHQDNFRTYLPDARVWGQVALSGLVVEGRNGYRAERMTIRELWLNEPCDGIKCEDPDCYHCTIVPDANEALCKLLGDRYQCDVSVRRAEWEKVANAQT